MSQYLVNGLMLGGIYGLIAVAFTMVYGVLGMVNFAFGEVFMFGAFGAAIAGSTTASLAGAEVSTPGLPFAASLVVGLLVGGTVGVLVERGAYKPLRKAPILSLLIASIAASIFLRAIGAYVFGAGQTPVANPIGGEPWTILGARVQRLDAVIFAIALLAMGLLTVLVRKTSIGRGIRATAEDPDAARLMGVGVDRVILSTFLLGSLLAALAGILYSAKFQFAAATMGFLPGLKGLVAAVLGGIGHIPGAFLGGLALGVLEELGAGYLPDGSAYRDVFAFLALGVILWVRPAGLFGPRVLERA